MNRGGMLDGLFGGWEFNGADVIQSGLPFTVTFSGSPFRYLPGQSRPDIVTTITQAQVENWDIGPHRCPQSARNPNLNVSSFAYPAAFKAGTLGRNTFDGPGMNSIQLSLAKWWRVKERYRFQLRLDGYNFPMKLPNFSNPSSVYNANTPGTFARVTGSQGSFSALGFGRPNFYLIGRFEF